MRRRKVNGLHCLAQCLVPGKQLKKVPANHSHPQTKRHSPPSLKQLLHIRGPVASSLLCVDSLRGLVHFPSSTPTARASPLQTALEATMPMLLLLTGSCCSPEAASPLPYFSHPGKEPPFSRKAVIILFQPPSPTHQQILTPLPSDPTPTSTATSVVHATSLLLCCAAPPHALCPHGASPTASSPHCSPCFYV